MMDLAMSVISVGLGRRSETRCAGMSEQVHSKAAVSGASKTLSGSRTITGGSEASFRPGLGGSGRWAVTGSRLGLTMWWSCHLSAVGPAFPTAEYDLHEAALAERSTARVSARRVSEETFRPSTAQQTLAARQKEGHAAALRRNYPQRCRVSSIPCFGEPVPMVHRPGIHYRAAGSARI
jgi:hypothetical protein